MVAPLGDDDVCALLDEFDELAGHGKAGAKAVAGLQAALDIFAEQGRQACNHLCPPNAARDFADGLAGELFLPDATGRSRIASYEGVSPLTVWLAAVVRHWAASERRRKVNHLERLNQIPDLNQTARDWYTDKMTLHTDVTRGFQAFLISSPMGVCTNLIRFDLESDC